MQTLLAEHRLGAAMSDVFKPAALVVLALALGQAAAQATKLAPTAQTGIGVWYAPGASANRDLWRPGDGGERLVLRIRVLNTAGVPVENAFVELWHADALGVVHADRYRAGLTTDKNGGFEVSTVLPGYIWGPRHVHVVVTHPEYAELITRVFFKRDPAVAESGYPELAIFLEDGFARGESTLFGEVELVLSAR